MKECDTSTENIMETGGARGFGIRDFAPPTASHSIPVARYVVSICGLSGWSSGCLGV